MLWEPRGNNIVEFTCIYWLHNIDMLWEPRGNNTPNANRKLDTKSSWVEAWSRGEIVFLRISGVFLTILNLLFYRFMRAFCS